MPRGHSWEHLTLSTPGVMRGAEVFQCHSLPRLTLRVFEHPYAIPNSRRSN